MGHPYEFVTLLNPLDLSPAWVLLDPDPKNSGAGIRMLRDAGITVVVGLLAEEAAEDLAGF